MPECRDAGAALMGRESLLLAAVLIATAVMVADFAVDRARPAAGGRQSQGRIIARS